jgi:hypothetical protein
VVPLPAIPVLGAQAATPSPTHVPTATATATELATATPQDATPTVFPQAVADRQAAASFSAATLGTAPDKTCTQGSDAPSFTSGTPIYINLCTSGNVASSSVSISIRQAGSVCTLPVTATNSYNCHASYTLAPGHYDILVTMRINGTTGTARDLRFTVTP